MKCIKEGSFGDYLSNEVSLFSLALKCFCSLLLVIQCQALQINLFKCYSLTALRLSVRFALKVYFFKFKRLSSESEANMLVRAI